MTVLKLAAIGLAAWAIALPAHAQCNYGDVKASLQAGPVFRLVQGIRGLDTRASWRVGSGLTGPCQYRLFNPPPFVPRVVTFKAGQWFLGGANWLWPYVDLGMTREDAVHDLSLMRDRAFLAKVDAWEGFDRAAVVQPQNEMAWNVLAPRDVVTATGEHRVILQQGFITQLPAGKYVSVYQSSYPGNPDLAELFPEIADWFLPFEDEQVVYLDVVP